ncbi:MAG: FkbM family methyltransferase [Phycisphaerales bacterium]
MDTALAAIALALALTALVVGQRQHRRAKRRWATLAEAASVASRSAAHAMGFVASERLRSAGRTPRYPVDFRADCSEDVLLFHLFEGRLDGSCLECGAFDGLTASVTYALDAIGWKTILIEASPGAAALCAKNRPASRVVHAAASARGASGTLRFVEVVPATANGAGAVKPNSFVLGAKTPKAIPAAHVQTVVDVPRTTMDEVLAGAGTGGFIDAAVIDVEGHEMDLFDGWDFAKCCPRVLVVEEDPPGGRPELMRLLHGRGMVSVGQRGTNQIMVHESQADLLARARLLMEG